MERLTRIGFRKAGEWVLSNGVATFREDDEVLCRAVNGSAYAFISDEEVFYIGKTTMSIKRRMYGYFKPGPTQATNIRVNPQIHDILRSQRTLEVLGFHLLDEITYPGFILSVPAGLEDSMIQTLNPPWNKRK
jgi:hypothetical protein